MVEIQERNVIVGSADSSLEATFVVLTGEMAATDLDALDRAYRSVSGWVGYDADGIPEWKIDDALDASISFEPSGLLASATGSMPAIRNWIRALECALQAELRATLIPS